MKVIYIFGFSCTYTYIIFDSSSIHYVTFFCLMVYGVCIAIVVAMKVRTSSMYVC